MKSVEIRNMLGDLGYSNEHFSEDYTVQIDGTSVLKFDYVAFSDRYIKDISTSCIAIQEVDNLQEENLYVRNAKYMATPVLILTQKKRVHIWSIASNNQTLIKDDDEKLIHMYFEKNRFEFMSDNLIEAKMGLRQITIFEAAGLIDFSRDATCKILSEEFAKGLLAAKSYLKSQKNINNRDMNNITSITMHIISALIINSKININNSVPNVFELLDELSFKYKEYFSDNLMFKYGRELVSEIYSSLNVSINYQSVDHELLGYFYESTLLQLNKKKANTIRKEFGIYYTPKILSQEIANSIPIENIPVFSRKVLDGTCGSGSLLLSACKRLEDLIVYEMDEFSRHDYLTKMIAGYDLDKFASEVARLSFLLYSLPYGNKWNVKAGDLLKLNSVEESPYIIMGNPPYEEKRGEKTRKQKATKFLDKYIDWLHEDGYIGIILPESFLQNDSSIFQRKNLLENFDILELWSLPGTVFENNCSTIVIIAQKKKQIINENVTKIKILTRNVNSLNNYFKLQKWDFIYFANIQKNWSCDINYKMNFSPIEGVLKKIEMREQTLNDVTDNIMGVMLPSYYEFSKMQFDGWVPYISNAKDFQKYYLSDKMQDEIKYLNYDMTIEEEKKIKETYRGMRLRRKNRLIYEAKSKVLIKMSSTPGELNCISAMIDENQYFPSHSFFAVVTSDDNITNEAICALINSKLINSYVRKECVKRTIPTDVVRKIPIPVFNDYYINQFKIIFEKIKEAYADEDDVVLKHAENELNDLIYNAYELTEEEIQLVEEYYNIYNGNASNKNDEKIDFSTYTNVSGQVEDIDVDNWACKVCLLENGETEIAIDKSMPGWFLRKGAEFSAKMYNGKLYEIKPLVYSYLNDDEVISFFRNELLQEGE
ncbi:MAG: hypothetical protein RHS_4818 [Robinsoniella sp. RHS]|uniref:HsdM family class I SAM-dependent methyltransferase n=1 Tax=Robinsoniella sp. RHS TaxID=1504536 RepID=UPI00064A5111|nr:MAG: hypothetical protein RHS_4818 [Robinsoniella sp. RHS]